MSQALLYTSAPQGLRQGAAGYCTVGSTPGMDPNLAGFLEGFSGYPHPFKPPDPRTKENPVNYSFVQWSLGGQRYYVLSRVSDAGLDYTGRTNLLAHHIALTRREIEACPGGPAWAMASPAFFMEKWDGQLVTLASPKLAGDESPQGPCESWKAAAGDAGYAGVLAETALEKAGRPVTIIFPVRLDVLPLVIEAQRLLPLERRWNATFSTFYSRIYSSFDIQWRFLFDETADARQARRDTRALIIDLCKGPLPEAEGGELVTAARQQGVLPAAKAKPREAVARPQGPPPRRALQTAARVAASEIAEVELLTPAMEVEGPPIGSSTAPFNPFQNARRRSVVLHYSIAGAGAFVLTAVLAILLVVPVVLKRRNRSVVADAAAPAVAERTAAAAVAIQETTDSVTASNSTEATSNESIASATPVERPLPLPETSLPPTNLPEATSSAPGSSASLPNQVRPPLKDVPDVLELPSRGSGASQKKVKNNPLLAKINAASAEECALTLIGMKEAFGGIADEIQWKESDESNPPARTWTLTRTPAGGASKHEVIAVFRLFEKQLTFRWDRPSPSAMPESLLRCLLAIRVGSDYKLCRLSRPDEVDSIIRISELPAGKKIIQLPGLDGTVFAGIDTLQFESRAADTQAEVKPESSGLTLEGRRTDKGVPLLGLNIEFKKDPEQEHKRIVEIFPKPAFKKNGDNSSNYDVIYNSTYTFNVKEMDNRIRKEKDRIKTFTSQLDSANKLFDKAKRELEPFIKIAAEDVHKLRAKAKHADASKKPAIDYVLGKAESAHDELRGRLLEAKKSVDDIAEKLEPIKEELAILEAVNNHVKLVQERGHLEFRVFFQVKDEDQQAQTIEIYRTKDFSPKVESPRARLR